MRADQKTCRISTHFSTVVETFPRLVKPYRWGVGEAL